MEKTFRFITAIALLSAMCLAACNKVELTEDPIDEPGTEVTPSQGWTVAISATIGGDASTKALTEDPSTHKLIATFETTDNIYVYNVTKAKADSSPLHPDKNGASAVLTGTLSESYDAGDVLVLCYNPEYIGDYGGDLRFSYQNQVGTLATVADFAKADKTISAAEATAKELSGSVTFENLQSIFRFSFTDGTSPVPVQSLTITTDQGKLVRTDLTYRTAVCRKSYRHFAANLTANLPQILPSILTERFVRVRFNTYISARNKTIIMDYLKRVIDDQLQDYLDAFGAVNIEGPKWCGKTTTAKQKAASIIELQDTDKRDEYLATAQTKASLLLDGATPRLIDEWQDAPTLWDAVRVACDRRQKPSQFILTGSAVADTEEAAHTGTGRIAGLTMYPMSLYETGESTGAVSLEGLFDNPAQDIATRSKMSVEDLIFAACRGGWPAALQPTTDRGKLLIAKNYVKTVCEKDISRVAKEKLDPKIAKAILRSYARNISSLADKTTILADVTANNDSLVRSTFDKYVSAFEKLFVIQDIGAWNPSIRSKTAIRSGEKRSFCDPSVAVAALGLGPGQLQTQLKTFGFIFECMCVRDLKVYSAPLGGEISHYRDRYGLESDIVLHLEDGRYALIECKLGSSEIEDGASHLKELVELIRKHNQEEKQVPLREPDLLIVVTGGEYAYSRPDGVHVIPLACLKQ